MPVLNEREEGEEEGRGGEGRGGEGRGGEGRGRRVCRKGGTSSKICLSKTRQLSSECP